MKISFQLALLPAMLLATAGLSSAQTVPAQHPPAFTGDLGITFDAQHSLKVLTGQGFWLEGGSVQLGLPVYRNLATVIDFTGTHTNSIGTSGVPLTVEMLTFGPRYRFRPHARWSPYAQALFGLAIGSGSSFPVIPLNGTSNSNATSFGFQTGGGIDYRATHTFSVRVLDAGYVRSNLPNAVTNEQNTLRLGAGIVARFGSAR